MPNKFEEDIRKAAKEPDNILNKLNQSSIKNLKT